MIDLNTWNLSVPMGSVATTIDTPTLIKGYKNEFFHADTGTLFFWAPVTGSKTDNAKFPRSELRETNPDGSLRNWLFPAADNALKATLMVNKVPSTGKIVIGQIHVFGSTEPLLKVEYQYKEKLGTGNIVAKVRPVPGQEEPDVIIVASGVPLNKSMNYTIHLTQAGTLSVNAYNMNWKVKISSAWKTKPMYFKAGVYTQDNTGYATEGGATTFTKLAITHTKG
jgi:hypothetical protein